MSPAGYIYVLYNASTNGIVKIGKTQRDPDERAKELSSATGVPTPFFVVYQAYFDDCDKAELFVQSKLEKYRVANNREFFQVRVQIAIDTIIEAKIYFDNLKSRFSVTEPDPSDDNNELLDSLTLDEMNHPGKELFESAEAYYIGLDDAIQDYDEAFTLYQKAAKLGYAKAFLRMGDMLRDGDGCTADNKRALEYYKQGIKNGDDEGWGEMARVFYSDEHWQNEEKCWNKYFSSPHFTEFEPLHRRYAIFWYVRSRLMQNKNIEFRQQIALFKDEVLEVINDMVERAKEQNKNSILELFRKMFHAINGL